MLVCVCLSQFNVEVTLRDGVLDADEIDFFLSVDMLASLKEVGRRGDLSRARTFGRLLLLFFLVLKLFLNLGVQMVDINTFINARPFVLIVHRTVPPEWRLLLF